LKCKDCVYYDGASEWCGKKLDSPDPELERDCEWYDEPVSPYYATCKPEVDFRAGVPQRRSVMLNGGREFVYPEDIIGKKCGECERCRKRDNGEPGWHCSIRPYDLDIDPDGRACVDYWDRAEQEAADAEHDAAFERRREELWAIYSKREPVKMLIVDGYYGREIQCPVCGEMPYSTEQCNWCGQRFIQDAETVEWCTPLTVDMVCPNCGEPGKAVVARRNGHKHFSCAKCGCRIME